MEEVGSSGKVDSSGKVGSSWKVSLSEKVVLVLLVVEVGAVKEGSGFLPSRPGSRSWPSRRVQVLEAGQRRIKIRYGFAPCFAGRFGQPVGR